MRIKSFFAMLTVILLAVACNPSEKAFEPSLEVNGIEQNTVSAPAAGTNFSFTVKGNVAYTIASDKEWATMNPASVENADKETLTTTVTVTVEANTAEEAREATIKITADGYASLDYTFTVNQAAAVYEKSLQVLNSTLSPVTETINVESSDAAASVMVVSTVSWTATSSASWLSVDPASATVENYEETPVGVNFQIEDNATTEAREATVTFAGEGVDPVTVTVSQEGNIPFEAVIELTSVSDFNPEYLSQYPDETSLGVVIGLASAPVVSGYYGLWKSSAWEDALADWNANAVTTLSLLKQYGSAMSDKMISSINGDLGYYGTIFYGLDPDTEYILIVYLEDEKGRTILDYSVCKTKAIDYNGFLKIGEYNMECIDDEDYKNTTTFTVSPSSNENEFYVANPIINDGSTWLATYDPDAKTLSLNGIERGYEEYGNQFGYEVIYGWWNKASMYAYAYVNLVESSEEEGDASMVFSVNSEGYISALTNYISGVLVYKIDESFNILETLGWGTLFIGAKTTITHATTTSAASVESKKCSIKTMREPNSRKEMRDLAYSNRNFVELR